MTAAAAHSVHAFRGLLTARLGLEFPEERLHLLAEVLTARAHHCQQSVESYLSALIEEAPQTEFSAIAARLSVPESYFFRNAEQFRALRDCVVPTLLADRPLAAPLRVLSAGCASGEEPYSLAITLSELLDGQRAISIVAVDMNPEAIERARRAVYSEWALRETRTAVRNKWFEKNGRGFELRKQTLGFVQFIECNLAGPAPEVFFQEHYDLIFCRNFLMYLTREKYVEVAKRLGQSLVPGGFLFLGHAETLRGADQGFESHQSHGTFYYRKDSRPGVRRARLLMQPASSRDSEPNLEASPIPEAELDAQALPWFEAITQATARVVALSEGLALDAARSGQLSNTVVQDKASLPRVPEPRAVNEAGLGPVLNLLRKERYSEALTLVEAVADSVDSGAALLLRALLLTHADRGVDAEQCCRELLALDPRNAGAHYIHALCRDGASDPSSALRHYEQAAALDPTFAMPRLQLGLLQRRLLDAVSARRNLALACTLLEKEADGRVLLFGGGFSREVLVEMGAAALRACEQGAA